MKIRDQVDKSPKKKTNRMKKLTFEKIWNNNNKLPNMSKNKVHEYVFPQNLLYESNCSHIELWYAIIRLIMMILNLLIIPTLLNLINLFNLTHFECK